MLSDSCQVTLFGAKLFLIDKCFVFHYKVKNIKPKLLQSSALKSSAVPQWTRPCHILKDAKLEEFAIAISFHCCLICCKCLVQYVYRASCNL